MKETIYNLYLFHDGEIISEIGAVRYEVSGSDPEKIELLQDHAQQDVEKCKRYRIPDRFKFVDHDTHEVTDGVLRYSKYRELCDYGLMYEVFEEVLSDLNASEYPLCCVSDCINGVVVANIQQEIKNSNRNYKRITMYSAPDYLEQYIEGNEFQLNRLINDDFFSPVKLLLNYKYYVSAMKLLVSAIDSFAFLEYGDTRQNFVNWLESYMDYNRVNVSPEEIWELRNAIIHMTSYDSRKVDRGEITRIILQAGVHEEKISNVTDDGKLLNIHKFYMLIAEAVEKWLTSIHSESRLEQFVERYDKIASEKRSSIMIFE